jgi:hypothetical protein
VTRVLHREFTGNRQADNQSRNTEEFARIASQSPFWDGNSVTVTLQGATITNVGHGLGRAYQGWVITRLVALAPSPIVFEVPAGPSVPSNPSVWVPMEATAACQVTLWFY